MAPFLLLGQAIWIRATLRRRGWVRTKGMVVRSWIEKGKSAPNPEIRFTYAAGEIEYTSEGFWLLRLGGWDEEDAASLLKPFREGVQVDVRYDPSHPARAFVEIIPDGSIVSYIFIGLWAAGLTVALAFAVMGIPTADTRTDEKILWLIAASPLAALALWGAQFSLSAPKRALRHWRRAQAQVVVTPVQESVQEVANAGGAGT